MRNSKKKTIFHIFLLVICILCTGIILFWKRQTECIAVDIEVYIDEIQEDEIVVKGMPYVTNFFDGEYRIQIKDTLIIKDSKGGVVDIQQLNRGDILLFDYHGPWEFRNGALLNGIITYAYNFRISDEKLNLKFWRLE